MAENIRDEGIDDWQRFVSVSEDVKQSLESVNPNPNPIQTNPAETYSDPVYNHAVKCLQMFMIWGPAYKEYMEKNLNDLKEIDSSGTGESRALLSLKKDKSREDTELISHLESLFNLIDSLEISLDSMEPAEESKAAEMVELINSKTYPMIFYYTSQSGMKFWFKKILTGLYSQQDKRMIQFGDQNLYNRIKDETMSSLLTQSTSESDRKMKLVASYRMAASALNKFVLYEVQNLDLNDPSARLPNGVVYRGEKMTDKEFETFKEKVNPLLLKAYFQPRRFTEGLCSTSTDKKRTFTFLDQQDKFKNVIHTIHLVSPTVDELKEFYHLFPDRYLMCASIKIDSHSYFGVEKEVMATSLYVLTLNSYPSKSSDIFQVECVLSPLYLYNGHSQQEKVAHSMEYRMAMMSLSMDSNSLLNYYRKYPHQLAVNYLEFLNGMVANRFMHQYYTAVETKNEEKSKWCNTLIEKCLENMERLKSYQSVVQSFN